MLSRSPDPDGLLAPLLELQGPFGLAVSGGADSLALLVLAAEWGQRHGKRLIVYTLDHGLRPEAGSECAMVAREAEKLGLAVRILHWSEAKPATGLQAAARTARYRLIGAAMRADGAKILMTAHHADDQAETVLMRLAHGSGVGGVGGMTPMASVEGVMVFRPLLKMSRADLAAIVHQAGLAATQDPSNADRHYERVRWRGLLPSLAEEGLTAERLTQFAGRAQRAHRALENIAARAFSQHVTIDSFGVVRIAADFFATAEEEVALRVLRRALAWAGGDSRAAGLRQVEQLHRRLCESGPIKETLSGAVIYNTGPSVMLFREARRIPQIGLTLSPGETAIWDRRFEIRVTPKRGDLVVLPGTSLTRRRLSEVTGLTVSAPVAALHGLPVVRDGEGAIRAVGPLFQSSDVEVAHLFDPKGEAC